jgi:uncharacterized protein with GYD domain
MIKLASSFFNLALSSSSAFSLRASDTSMPPTFDFHLKNVALLIPCVPHDVPRSTVAIGGYAIVSLPRMIEVTREVSMARLITRGRLTQEYAKRFVGSPEDREPAVRKLVEASGGKLISFYFTTGDSDFMLITEGEGESIIAALLATAASGMVSDVSTCRAWTGAEFKAVADKAAKLTGEYRLPGK